MPAYAGSDMTALGPVPILETESMLMPMEFGMRSWRENGACVVALSGELDLASSNALSDHLERIGQAGADPLVVDLRGLRFMDATGLSVLMRAQARARQRGSRFGVVRNGPQVQRLMSLTGDDRRLRLVDAPEALLAA